MLSDEQVRRYLERIGIHAEDQGDIQPTKENLDLLVYAHQTHVPFETLGVHRLAATPDTSIDHLYDKVVERNLGGYCFELNKLFEELLLSLGFDARPVLSRAVRGRDARMPINHRGTLVRIDGVDHSVDVGFGGPMPAGALALLPDSQQEIAGEIYIPVDMGNGWWKVDRRTQAEFDLHDDDLPARRQTELEICTAPVEDIDFDALNTHFSQPGTLFRDHDVVNLRTNAGYKGYKDGVLTIRENGQKEVVSLDTEDKMDSALKDHFNLNYS